MHQHSDNTNESNNQLNKQSNRTTIIENANDGKYPQESTSVAQECYYYLADKLRLLWYGDWEAIEYTGKVDLDYYCQMPRWDIGTAISLSLGQSPKKIKRYWHRFSPEFKQQYGQRKELLKQATKHNLIPYSFERHNNIFDDKYYVVKPINFVKWAKLQNWELFFEMEESIRKYAIEDEDVNLVEKCMELEFENKILKQKLNATPGIEEKPLNKRIESSYQMLIAGLIRLKFPSNESINAHNISNHLAELDLPFKMISEDNIHDKLESVKRLLDIHPKRNKTKSSK